MEDGKEAKAQIVEILKTGDEELTPESHKIKENHVCEKSNVNKPTSHADAHEFQMPLSPNSSALKPPVGRTGSRRSMLNIVRRQTKSMMTGLAFEDRVAAIPTEGPAEERLASMLRISLSATLRSVQESHKEEEDEDISDQIAEVNGHLQKVCSVDKLKESGLLKKTAEAIASLSASSTEEVDGNDSHTMLPGRVRCLRNYVKEVNRETEEWKQIRITRKEEYMQMRSEKKMVLAGAKKLGPQDREALGLQGDELLNTDFTKSSLKSLQDQQERLILADNKLALRLAQSRKRAQKASSALSETVEKVKKRFFHDNLKDTSASTGSEVVRGAKDFEKQVNRWLREVKKGPAQA